MPRPSRRTIAALILAAGLCPWAAAAGLLDQIGQQDPAPGPYDAIVVAGCRVDPGGVASPALRARTELGVALFERGLAPELAFTGGVGEHPPSEAEVGAALAEQLGVPGAALVREQRSTSTEENARYLAEERGYQRILLVTDAYHVFRAQQVFARHFDEVEGTGALSPAWERTRGSLREVLAVSLYRAQGRIALFP